MAQHYRQRVAGTWPLSTGRHLWFDPLRHDR